MESITATLFFESIVPMKYKLQQVYPYICCTLFFYDLFFMICQYLSLQDKFLGEGMAYGLFPLLLFLNMIKCLKISEIVF